jgi:hypothetical protein
MAMTSRNKPEPGSKDEALVKNPKARRDGTRAAQDIGQSEDARGAGGYAGVSAEERMQRLRRWLG